MGVVVLHDKILEVDMDFCSMIWLNNPSLGQEYDFVNMMQHSCCRSHATRLLIMLCRTRLLITMAYRAKLLYEHASWITWHFYRVLVECH